MEIAAVETGGEFRDRAKNIQELWEQKENEWAVQRVTGGQLAKKVGQEDPEGRIANCAGLSHWVSRCLGLLLKSPSQGAASASRPPLFLSLEPLRVVGKLSGSM